MRDVADAKAKKTENQSLKNRFLYNLSFIKELYLMTIKSKKWWLLPIILFLLLVSSFMVLVGGNSILPAIYALF